MKNQKTSIAYRVLTMLLVICMLFQTLPPIRVGAAAASTITAGSAAELPGEIPAGTTVELTADITLTAEQQISLIAGTLDGKGHTITVAGKPLAAEVTGTVQNLGVAGSIVTDQDPAAPVALKLTGGTIRNSFSTVTVESTAGFSGMVFGVTSGMVGSSVGGTIRNCFTSSTQNGMDKYGLAASSNNVEKKSEFLNSYYVTGSKVTYGNAYNENEPSVAQKTLEEMQAPEFVELLNTGIQDTGFKWEAVSGALPKLVSTAPSNPQISTPEELPAEIKEGETYELAADITLTAEQQISLIAGTLDGKGHTITVAGKPLAAEVTGTVQNLGVASNAAITGSMFGPTFGSIAVRLTGGSILNSFSIAEVTDNYNDAGALVGISEGGTIRNSYYGGTITGKMFGGLIGTSASAENPSVITECYFTNGNGPVSMGNAYNKDEGRFAMKTLDEMKAPEFVELLNTNIQDTGFKWGAVPGALPKLVPADGGSVDPDVPQLDTSALEAAIAEAQALKSEEYTAETWQVLEAALTAAQETLNKEGLTQKEANDAAANLRAAIDGLRKPLPTKAVALPAEGVIEITSQEQIKEMSIGSTKGKFYRLANDIVIDDAYWFGPTFGGVLDGSGHTITVKNNTPIWNEMAEGAVIQNVGFLGAAKSGNDAGLVAIKSSGMIVNCWSRATMSTEGMNNKIKHTGGFVGTLTSGGVISNSYVAGTVAAKGNSGDGKVGAFAAVSEPNTLVQGCFWLNTSADKAVGSAQGQVVNSVSLRRGGFYSQENLKKLNDNRGQFGKEWTIDNDGWFHLGAAGSFNPELGSGLVFTYDPIYGKEPVSFNSGDGLELSLGEFLVPAGQEGDMPKYVGHFSNPNFKGEIACVPEYVGVGQGNHNVMVSQDCGLNVQDSGSVTVHVMDKSSWSGTGFEKELTSFTIVITPIEAEELRLVPHGKYVTGTTVAGSGNVVVEGQVKVGGQWKKAPATMFSFTTEGEIFGEGDGFYATAPGQITITAKGFGREATLVMESTYVPVTYIMPFPHGLHWIHERDANSNKMGEFLDLNLADGAGRVDIRPENASYRGDGSWKMESSDPSVAEYIPDFLLAVLPYKAGKVTLTAISLDPNLKAPVTGSTELELRYVNPVTSVAVNMEELAAENFDAESGHMLLNGDASIKLPIHFTGTKAPEMRKDPRDGVVKEFSWHVSEPEMIWTQEGDGEVEIVIDGSLGMWVKSPLENCVANDQFKITGVANGTVTVTGVPADKTNKVEPVVFTVEVTGVQDAEPYDIPGFIASAKPSAVTGVLSGINYKCGSDEWQVLSLLRAGVELPQDKLDAYYQSVVDTLQTWKPNRKPTDYERVALALSAMGKDITNVGGINLAERIYNHKYLSDGSNEVAFALLALDARRTQIPADARNTRASMVDLLLSFQNEDGGFGLAPGSSSGADTTSMSLQALVPYQDQAKVAAAIENGLVYLKNKVHTKAGHFDEGTVEANAQTIIAMAVLGRDLLTEPGFSSARYNLMKAMEPYHVAGEGFRHTAIDPKINPMATAQALQALDAYDRFLNGKAGYWSFDEAAAPELNADGHAVAPVLDAIHKLPDADSVSERDAKAIEGARALYEALTPEQKALVNAARLTAAEEALENLAHPDPDKEAAEEVMAIIEALPTDVKLSDKAAIEAARAAYNKLTEAQKALVANINKLVAAENALAGLESGDADSNKIYLSVERFVIGQGFVTEPMVVEFTEGESYADILDRVLEGRASIRDNHNYLEMIRDANLGPDYVTIPDYIVEMSRDKKGNPTCTTEIVRNYYHERGRDAWPEAGEGALGEFSYSSQSGWIYHENGVDLSSGIGETAAKPGAVVRVMYTVYGLGDDLKLSPVTNKDNLIRAMALVNAEPESVRNDAALKAAYAEAAESAENMVLPTEQVRAVTDKLLEALANAKGVSPEDQAAAKKAADMIDAIGTVTLESGDKISAARQAYNQLTQAQKQLVSNYKTLTDAEAAFKQLQAESADQTAARKVADMIDTIGTVTLESADKIAAARKAYEALTPAQKALVSNYDKLVAAERALAQLKATPEDRAAAQKVIDMIDAIGTVTLDSAKQISDTRMAYEQLTDLQKQLVYNYDKLVAAEKTLAQLKGPSHREIYETVGQSMEAMAQKYVPEVGSVGGEWIIIGLARSGRKLPVDAYYANVEAYVRRYINDKEQLHRAKSSDNSRVILALTAIGKDVTDVAGHNLLMGLTDMKYLARQGINGPIWALIALDSHNYEIPQNPAAKDQATREKIIRTILDAQLEDGGWDLSHRNSDVDMTGMALQALAPYYGKDAQVKEAVDKALELLGTMQNEDGTFGSIDGKSSESSTQVIVALTALGINPDTDYRFVKNGISVIDGLCAFASGDGFKHILNGERDQMGTEQGYYALTSYYRLLEGKTSLYDMTDVTLGEDTPVGPTVPEKPVEPQNPQTGDNMPLGVLIAVVAVAGVALVAIILYVSLSKKKHR